MSTEAAAGPDVAWLARLLEAAGGSGLPRLLRVLLRLGWHQRHRMIPASGAALMLSALALAPPALLAHLIDNVFPSRAAMAVVAVGVALGCIALMDAACAFARRLLSAAAGLELRRALLEPAFAAVLRLPVDRRESRDQGLLGRTFEEAERLAQGASDSLIEGVLGFGTIAVLSVAMLIVDPLVGLIVIAIVAALAVLHVLFARALRTREGAWFEARSRYWAHLVEAIAYVATVRFNSAHGFAERRFAQGLASDLDAHFAVVRMSAGLDATGRFAGGLITAAIALAGGLRVIDGSISIGDFVLFLSVGGSLSAPVLNLVKTFDDFQAMTVSVARLSDIASGPHEEVGGAAALNRPGGARLEVIGLTFRYEGTDALVLQDLSFALAPGDKVAVVGPSGIGKSTLASLLFAARRPARGKILLDGEPIETIPLGALRRRVVVVPHEIDVFTGSVAENLVIGLPATELDDIRNAAAIAAIDADIMRLPQGYGTQLGQGGVDLSAGQRQRLGIARALLLDPDVLILDESTSSLDAATETRVLDAVLAHCAATTIVAITHRESVARRMQRSIAIGNATASS
ncbi:MAG: ATP-binding cassette domain-containing protein [Afipia sp.]|nr:ATP-binding cassette domain-containing protein [Afipia sp.]